MDDMNKNEDFMKFLEMMAKLNKAKEMHEDHVAEAAHKVLAKMYMDLYMELQRVGFTAEQAFDLVKVTIKEIMSKEK